MKGVAVILASALVALSVATDKEVVLNNRDCPHHTLYGFLEHLTYCNLYYLCVGGAPVEQHCPVGLVFNVDLGVCDWPNNVNCNGKDIFVNAPDNEEAEVEEHNQGGNTDPSQAAAICSENGSNGVLVAHEECDKYYICDGFRPVDKDCPAGLMYNAILGLCDWHYNVDCSDRVLFEWEGNGDTSDVGAICKADKTNSVLVAHERCDVFYKCMDGAAISHHCPPGLQFSVEHELCDWPFNVDCSGRITE